MPMHLDVYVDLSVCVLHICTAKMCMHVGQAYT